jgi:hypothetical protein
MDYETIGLSNASAGTTRSLHCCGDRGMIIYKPVSKKPRGGTRRAKDKIGHEDAKAQRAHKSEYLNPKSEVHPS